MNPFTGSLNTTVKRMVVEFVGSVWEVAWLIVTVGFVRSMVSSFVEESFPVFPAWSDAVTPTS